MNLLREKSNERDNVVSEGWLYVYKILWTACVFIKFSPVELKSIRPEFYANLKKNIEFLILDIYEYKMFFLKKIEFLRLEIDVAFSPDQQLHSKCNTKFWTVEI